MNILCVATVCVWRGGGGGVSNSFGLISFEVVYILSDFSRGRRGEGFYKIYRQDLKWKTEEKSAWVLNASRVFNYKDLVEENIQGRLFVEWSASLRRHKFLSCGSLTAD